MKILISTTQKVTDIAKYNSLFNKALSHSQFGESTPIDTQKLFLAVRSEIASGLEDHMGL